MSTARKIVQPRTLLIFVILLSTMKAASGGCECKSSNSTSSNTPAPPPNPQVSVRNEYGVDVGYEIWTGSNLEYKNGTVYGDSLTRAVSLTTLTNNTTAGSVATISYDTSFLVVFGVQDGPVYVYITNKVVNNYKSTATFTLKNTGTIQ